MSSFFSKQEAHIFMPNLGLLSMLNKSYFLFERIITCFDRLIDNQEQILLKLCKTINLTIT